MRHGGVREGAGAFSIQAAKKASCRLAGGEIDMRTMDRRRRLPYSGAAEVPLNARRLANQERSFGFRLRARSGRRRIHGNHRGVSGRCHSECGFLILRFSERTPFNLVVFANEATSSAGSRKRSTKRLGAAVGAEPFLGSREFGRWPKPPA